MWNLATFKSTNKGTVAKIINTGIFDINIDGSDRQNDNQATNKRPLTRILRMKRRVRMGRIKRENSSTISISQKKNMRYYLKNPVNMKQMT